jgi:phage baseplate assembly protein V
MKQLNSVFVAVVVDNADPEGLGRVKVRFSSLGTLARPVPDTWARMATLMAGKDQGSWFLPDVGEEVLVAFEAGNVAHPFVIGSLWSANSPPPQTTGASNNQKVLRSRNGVKVTLDDDPGQERFIVETPGGQQIILKDGPGSIAIEVGKDASIKLDNNGIRIETSFSVKVSASQVSISTGMLTVDAGMSKFSGVVKADTVITNSVVSASYTPGAGNIW